MLSDRAEIRDSASETLASIRHDMRIAHERLLTKLQRMVSDPHNTPYLQEALITQRDGRYVLPLRAEFKGRIKAIVHDQSSSGATLFIEPLGVVDLNNQLRELQLAERDEERRILSALSQQVAAHSQEILLRRWMQSPSWILSSPVPDTPLTSAPASRYCTPCRATLKPGSPDQSSACMALATRCSIPTRWYRSMWSWTSRRTPWSSPDRTQAVKR